MGAAIRPKISWLKDSQRESCKVKRSVRAEEQPVRKFKGQEPMDLSRIVSIALQVSVYNVSDRFRVDIRARQGSLVEQHFADVVGKFVAIPDPEMKHLVTAQPDALQVKRSK